MSSIDALQKLKQINLKLGDVYLPSSGKNVKIKPITIKQQKDVIKSALDEMLAGLHLNIETNCIIRDNTTSETPIYVIDKPILMLNLKKLSTNSTSVKVVQGDVTHDISIDELLTPITNKHVPVTSLTEVLSFNEIDVHTKVPTIDEEIKVSKEALKTLAGKNERKYAKDLVGELFIYELVKFVDKIVVKGDNALEVKFDELTIRQQVETIETLSIEINKKLLGFIDKIKKLDVCIPLVTVNGSELPLNIDISILNYE